MIKLSSRDKEVITCAALSAQLTVPEICQKTGYRPNTVRYSLQRARELNFIAPHAMLDTSPLGLQMYEYFFSIPFMKEKQKQQLIDAIIASPYVSWLGEFTGEFQFGMIICTRSARKVQSVLDQLSEKHGELFSHKISALQLGFTQFRPKNLSETSFTPGYLTIGANSIVTKIDELDHNILRLLSASTLVESRRELARRLNIGISTLHYRLKSLEERGLIRGYINWIYISKIGYLTYKILLSTKSITPKFRQDLFKFCLEHVHVVHYTENIGAFDFEISISVPEPQRVIQFSEEIRSRLDPQIADIKVFPSFRLLKSQQYPFEKLEQAMDVG